MSLESTSTGKAGLGVHFEYTGVIVDSNADFTDITGEITLYGSDGTLGVEIHNLSGSFGSGGEERGSEYHSSSSAGAHWFPLSAVSLFAKFLPTGAWHEVCALHDTGEALVTDASSGLNTLAVGARGWSIASVSGFYAVKIGAKSAGAGYRSIVDCRGSVSVNSSSN